MASLERSGAPRPTRKPKKYDGNHSRYCCNYRSRSGYNRGNRFRHYTLLRMKNPPIWRVSFSWTFCLPVSADSPSSWLPVYVVRAASRSSRAQSRLGARQHRAVILLHLYLELYRMASKGKTSPRDSAVLALYRITRDRRDPDDLWKDISSPLSAFATDQTIALVFGAAIEQALEVAISTHFVLDDDGCARMFNLPNDLPPIPSFAVKISLGYALGIYERHIRDELNLIKAIRNAFAHSAAELSFDDSRIIDACAHLWLPKKWKDSEKLNRGENWTPREQYMTSAKFLFLYLENPDRGIKPKRYSTSPFYSVLEMTETSPKK